MRLIDDINLIFLISFLIKDAFFELTWKYLIILYFYILSRRVYLIRIINKSILLRITIGIKLWLTILIDNVKIFNYFNLNIRFLFKGKSIYLINTIRNE